MEVLAVEKIKEPPTSYVLFQQVKGNEIWEAYKAKIQIGNLRKFVSGVWKNMSDVRERERNRQGEKRGLII